MLDKELKHTDWHQNMLLILSAELLVSQLEQRKRDGEPVDESLNEALAMLSSVEAYVNATGIEKVMGIE